MFEGANRKVECLENLTLEFYENEFLCIMGPSGCGKTTLLNIVAGFIPTSSGTVEIHGRVVREPGPDRAVVFQSDAVFPWMTVEENIGYNAKIMKKPKSKQKEIVGKFLGLVGKENLLRIWRFDGAPQLGSEEEKWKQWSYRNLVKP